MEAMANDESIQSLEETPINVRCFPRCDGFSYFITLNERFMFDGDIINYLFV